ncbi:MAG: coenzyme F420-0:L-glutamate ligase [Patescibacteria group bacterium]|nr:coenzyme F420-0:L-glutamate ligase [Patescibacteria group bacterium]
MKLIPIKTKILKPGEKVFDLFLKHNKYKIKNGDIIALASKIVSYEQENLVELKKIKATKKAKILAKKYELSPEFCQLVIDESDKIIGGVKKALLTLKDGLVLANAGLDHSNVKKGLAALWPSSRHLYLDKLRKAFESHYKPKIGLIMVDSHCSPLRQGTTGLAIAISGFKGTINEKGKHDLFKNKMEITYHNIADDLAAAANGLMGERNQKIPFVIIKNFKIKKSNLKASKLSKELLIKPSSCLFRHYHVK